MRVWDDKLRREEGDKLEACPTCRTYLRLPTPGSAVACFIHKAIGWSSMSFKVLSSTPRVALPMATGVTGGTGLSVYH